MKSSAVYAPSSARDGNESRLSAAAWTFVFALAGTAVVLIATQAALGGEREAPDAYPIFQRLFAFNDRASAFAVIAALLATAAWPRLGVVAAMLADACGRRPMLTSTVVFGMLALGSRFVYLAHPLAMDEYAPWMQAHAFAQGSLAMHVPPDLVDHVVVRAFQGYFIAVNHATGELASMYWPGLAVLETPFVWFGAPWLLNPLLAAASVWLMQDLACRLADDARAGGWAALFLLASPQFTVMSLSFYAMPALLASSLLYAWLLMKPGLGPAFLAGLLGGLALALHNPVPHSLVAAPFIVWLALRRDRRARLAALLLGYLPMTALLVVGWPLFLKALQAGEPVTRVAATATSASQGFVAEWATKATRVLALPNLDLATAKVQATAKIWLWSMPGLLLLAGVALQRAPKATSRLLVAGFALTYVFYWFIPLDQGHGWGYRYQYAVWGALPLLAAPLALATSRWRSICGAFAMAGLVATPMFWFQSHVTVAEALAHRIPPPTDGRWIVLVAQDTGRYRGDLVQNPIDGGRVLYLASRGDAVDAEWMRGRFPTARRVWSDLRGSAWQLPLAAR